MCKRGDSVVIMEKSENGGMGRRDALPSLPAVRDRNVSIFLQTSRRRPR